MSNMWYYDLVNADETLKKYMLQHGLELGDMRYVKDIVNTRIGMFTYEGLPSPLTSEILETALMFRNKLCFYYLKETDTWYLCFYQYAGEYNIYWKPKSVNLIALNGSQLATGVPYDDIVLVRDNTMDIIPFICVAEYIGKVKALEDSMMKVVNMSSLPLVIAGNKKLANQARQLANKLGHKDAFIIGDDSLVNSVEQFRVELPVQPEEIYQLKISYRNECFSSLGIYAVNEKRERMLVSEVAMQSDYTDFVYQNAKMERERFVKELNAKGLKIKLIETYNINYEETTKEEADRAGAIAEAENVGGDDNGQLPQS